MNFHEKPITFISHVQLKVQNLERASAFYQEIIGFKVLEQSENIVHLTADGKTVLLSIEQPSNILPKQERTTGLYHFAILLPKRSDLANIVQHLVDAGIRLGSADHLVSEALYLSDPDGNGIEIYADREPSEWTWQGDTVDMVTDPLNFPDLLASKDQSPWTGLPSGTVMGHIHLHVSELNNTEEFYTKGLGFEIVNRYGAQALFISDGKYHHHIGLNTWNGVGAPTPSPDSVGLESFTLTLSDEDKRNKLVTQLNNIGAEVIQDDDSVTVLDPSGNRIHLKV